MLYTFLDEEDADDCLNNRCANGAQCIDGLHSYTCQCVDGFSGILCESRKLCLCTVKSKSVDYFFGVIVFIF